MTAGGLDRESVQYSSLKCQNVKIKKMALPFGAAAHTGCGRQGSFSSVMSTSDWTFTIICNKLNQNSVQMMHEVHAFNVH